jgi:hypothetical protein
MAGAGYKLFVNGNTLSASDLNTYIQQQTVMVFASASARTTALSGVLSEGMVSYRLDSHVLEVYNGTIWEATETVLTTKGDLVTFDTAPNRLPVGTNGQVLTADSTQALGIKWGSVSSYSAPTIGSTSIPSGATVTTIAGLTLTAPVLNTPKISSTYTAKTASYTFASGDEGNIFSMNNAATQQFNIPTDATYAFAVGTEINVFWITGAGQPTIGAVTPGTTTVISTGASSATPKLRVVNSGATIKKLATDSWIVFGDIA